MSFLVEAESVFKIALDVRLRDGMALSVPWQELLENQGSILFVFTTGERLGKLKRRFLLNHGFAGLQLLSLGLQMVNYPFLGHLAGVKVLEGEGKLVTSPP